MPSWKTQLLSRKENIALAKERKHSICQGNILEECKTFVIMAILVSRGGACEG
jgi:hypothetical protein